MGKTEKILIALFVFFGVILVFEVVYLFYLNQKTNQSPPPSLLSTVEKDFQKEDKNNLCFSQKNKPENPAVNKESINYLLSLDKKRDLELFNLYYDFIAEGRAYNIKKNTENQISFDLINNKNEEMKKVLFPLKQKNIVINVFLFKDNQLIKASVDDLKENDSVQVRYVYDLSKGPSANADDMYLNELVIYKN